MLVSQFHIDTFGVSIHGREHPGMMAKVGWLARRWRGSVNLTRPDHVMWILHCTTEDGALPRSIPTRWFFGRQLATAGDCIWLPYVLTKRPYIGTTSMDAQVAFVMANMAQARRSSVAMDPFAGTGSILVALAHFGAHTIGMDYDIRAIRWVSA